MAKVEGVMYLMLGTVHLGSTQPAKLLPYAPYNSSSAYTTYIQGMNTIQSTSSVTMMFLEQLSGCCLSTCSQLAEAWHRLQTLTVSSSDAEAITSLLKGW